MRHYEKKFFITCICPRKIFLKNKYIYSDFGYYKGIKIIKSNLKFKHSRLAFQNADNIKTQKS